jgi:hypothetical protein
MLLIRNAALAFVGMTVLGAAPSTGQQDTLRWSRVDRRRDLVVYVDRWRVDTLGEGLFQVWMRWDFPTPRPGPTGQMIDHFLSHTILDCRHFRSRDTETAYYSGDTLRSRVAIPESQREWLSPPPQSVGETTITRGCLIALGKPTQEVR